MTDVVPSTPAPGARPPAQRSGVALASLICAVAALLLSPAWIIGLPLAVIAIVLGGLGWWATQRDPARPGRYQSIGGTVIGGIALVIAVVAAVWWFPPGELDDECIELGGVTQCYER